MAKVTFFGATQEVTGSSFLVEEGRERFLVDSGLFQGNKFAEERNLKPFPFEPASLDGVIITHAHLDHTGRLPKLVRDGFRGPIYATAATRDLAEILFHDAAEIMAEDAERDGSVPIYRPEDVPRVIKNFVPLDYHEAVPLPGGWRLRLWDAGHILGSSIVELAHAEETLVFSGDLGNPPVPILAPTESPPAATLVIMESTYGDRIHEPVTAREKLLREAILATMKAGGVLMIPSFALERTQELLYYLNHLRETGDIPRIPVFLDSPLAIHATKIFERHPESWSAKARAEFKADDFFEFDGLTMAATREESRAINAVPPPKVIIAGSGMLHGGRMLHHAKRYLADPHSTLLFIGYQAQGTLGRNLLDGRKRIKIHGEDVFVRARVLAIGAFSAHADQRGLVRWLKGMKDRPRAVALVHGEPDRMRGLEAAIERELNIPVSIPKNGETIAVPLDQGPSRR